MNALVCNSIDTKTNSLVLGHSMCPPIVELRTLDAMRFCYLAMRGGRVGECWDAVRHNGAPSSFADPSARDLRAAVWQNPSIVRRRWQKNLIRR